MAYKHISFMVPQGGALIAGSNSADTAGAENYTEKLNFRRESDGEVRREGWTKATAAGVDFSQLDSSGYPIRLIYQFYSEEKQVLVAAAGDKIYRLNEDTMQWVVIASGLQSIDIDPPSGVPSAIRWEAVAIDGYCIFNNGVDLPLFYREDWPCAFPIFSLRERGIIRCGTIAEFDGRLWIADVEYIEDLWFGNLMRDASQPYGIPELEGLSYIDTGIATYRVPHTVEYSAWRLTNNAAEARSAPHLFSQIYGDTDDAGVMIVTGFVSEISVTNGGSYANNTPPTITITDTKAGEHAEYPGGSGATAVATMKDNGDGTFSVDTVNVTAGGTGYRALSVTVTGDATLTATLTSTLQAVELPYPISVDGSMNPYFSNPSWVDAGKSSEPNAIRQADPLRIVDEGVTDAEVVSLSSSSDKTLIKVSVSSATTPNTDGENASIILLKEPDISSTDSSVTREASDTLSFPEDGSRILKMAKLGDKLLVYRQTGYIAITRGNTQSPFFYEERYRGERVADFRNTVISLNEERQMFVGYNGAFFITPSSVEPQPMPTFMNGPEFWRNITASESEHVFAVENGLTQEAMIIAPIGLRLRNGIKELDWGVVAFDMIYGTLSTIDSTFTTATTIFPSEKINSRWFLLATHTVADLDAAGTYTDSELSASPGSFIMRYGYGPAEGGYAPHRIFSRNGDDFESRIKFGKTDFGNRFSEKSLRSYLIHLSDAFPEQGYDGYMPDDYVEDDYLDGASAQVKIATFSSAPDVEEDEVTEDLSDMGTQNMIPLFARGNYFQDTVSIIGLDIGLKLTGRTFEVTGVQTRHVSEAVQVVEVVQDA